MDSLVALTSKAAEAFVASYYSALDSGSHARTTAVLALYSPAARISWNGNPIPYADLPTFVERMPKSLHEVQAFDCHPIPGSAATPQAPPSLLLSVTGQVTHGSQPAPSAVSTNAKEFEFLPRIFSQSFILAFDPRPVDPMTVGNASDTRYAVVSDCFRFVG